MMRLWVVDTRASRGRRLLIVQWSGRTATAWVHRFERPWLYREQGILCGGIGFVSFNVYSPKAFA